MPTSSGLAERPVRWIVDDAVAFTEREVRRGRRYAGIVLDPPSYGHGPDSGAWRIEDDLPPLLAAAGGLLEPDGFILLTAHTAGFEEDRLAAEIEIALRRRPRAIETGAAGADDRGRADPRSRVVRTVVGRGIMTSVTSPTPPVLTSFANPRVKAARALRDRRERDRTGLTLIDGAREVRRALDAGVEIVEAFVCDPLLAGPDARAALDLLRARGVPVQPTSEARLRQARVRRARRGHPRRGSHPVAGARPPSRFPTIRSSSSSRASRSPATSARCMRSADGAGADAVIAASPRTDLFNPNAIRASAGTMFTVPTGAAADGRGDRLASRTRAARSSRHASDAGRAYTDADLTGPLAIVLGAEADGLTDAWAADGIEAVNLPMLGVADSLNVSVSAAILLYEARRQRGLPSPDRKE